MRCPVLVTLHFFSCTFDMIAVGRLDPESVQACSKASNKAMSWMSSGEQHLLHSLSLVEWLPAIPQLFWHTTSSTCRIGKREIHSDGVWSLRRISSQPARAPKSSTSCRGRHRLMRSAAMSPSWGWAKCLEAAPSPGPSLEDPGQSTQHEKGKRIGCFESEIWKREDYQWDFEFCIVLSCRLFHTSRRCFFRFHRQVFWEREMVGIL